MQQGVPVGLAFLNPFGESLCRFKGSYVKGKSASGCFSFLLSGGRFKEKVLTNKAKQYNKFVHNRSLWKLESCHTFIVSKNLPNLSHHPLEEGSLACEQARAKGKNGRE